MSRPIVAGILTILGGLFILVGGTVFALIGAVFAIFGVFSPLFGVGILLGLLTLLAGVLMLAIPRGHTIWGILAIVLALVSIPFALAGLILGFVLAVLGGLLAMAWHPPPPSRLITVDGHVVPPSS